MYPLLIALFSGSLLNAEYTVFTTLHAAKVYDNVLPNVETGFCKYFPNGGILLLLALYALENTYLSNLPYAYLAVVSPVLDATENPAILTPLINKDSTTFLVI